MASIFASGQLKIFKDRLFVFPGVVFRGNHATFPEKPIS
jgi:hypothetical protein